MNHLTSLNNIQLREQLIAIMDVVAHYLKNEPDVDKFLDETDLFDEWEKALPEAEYPIFVIAVLNNTRRDAIMDTIINAILKKDYHSNHPKKSSFKSESARSHVGEHPFN
jgi:hypothetical protein|tara:strand:- start:283 stop:612 length:330 start_codon:yes stop_codon:yes gene_type:complete